MVIIRMFTENDSPLPWAVMRTSRVENLKTIITPGPTKKTRLKVKISPAYPDLQPSIKLDYSDILRGNEVLEEDLAEYLEHLNKTAQRCLTEKGEQVEEIRRQIEEITKLQEALQAHNRGDSVGIMSTARAARYGRQASRQEREIDFREMSKTTRTRMRFEAERDRFSSKNLFNVRYSYTSLSLEAPNVRKFISVSAPKIAPDNENDSKDFVEELKSQPTSTRNKGYLQQTLASQRGFRIMTRSSTYRMKQVAGDILPPRPTSGVLRSRSRRELELLCRVAPNESPVMTSNHQIDWQAVYENYRRKKLKQLKLEDEHLQDRIQDFLDDLERFNKKPHSDEHLT